MAMTLRLTAEETEQLRMQAELEHRSMHEVVRLSVIDRIAHANRARRIREVTRDVLARDAEALRMLAE